MSADSLFTLVVMGNNKMPEIKLSSRPFPDCYAVGRNFLDREAAEAFSSPIARGILVTVEEKIEPEAVNAATGTTYKVATLRAVILGKAPLATCVIVEE